MATIRPTCYQSYTGTCTQSWVHWVHKFSHTPRVFWLSCQCSLHLRGQYAASSLNILMCGLERVCKLCSTLQILQRRLELGQSAQPALQANLSRQALLASPLLALCPEPQHLCFCIKEMSQAWKFPLECMKGYLAQDYAHLNSTAR